MYTVMDAGENKQVLIDIKVLFLKKRWLKVVEQMADAYESNIPHDVLIIFNSDCNSENDILGFDLSNDSECEQPAECIYREIELEIDSEPNVSDEYKSNNDFADNFNAENSVTEHVLTNN